MLRHNGWGEAESSPLLPGTSSYASCTVCIQHIWNIWNKRRDPSETPTRNAVDVAMTSRLGLIHEVSGKISRFMAGERKVGDGLGEQLRGDSSVAAAIPAKEVHYLWRVVRASMSAMHLKTVRSGQ